MNTRLMIRKLHNVMADTYALYLKTQNYHWNVTGPQFASLHLLFEKQYQELALAIDLLAEHLRTFQERAPGTFEELNALKSIQDGDKHADGDEMLQHLAHDQHVMLSTLEKAFAAAKAADDELTMHLLADRMAVHKKNAWMLESIMVVPTVQQTIIRHRKRPA
ncbi:MAG: DNA starvation/stationary phase protection protein [Alphaproteobacteria bacterium]|nr:DNA starvation/stationary phase protection protein [Alphaproteobacteria bacterium]